MAVKDKVFQEKPVRDQTYLLVKNASSWDRIFYSVLDSPYKQQYDQNGERDGSCVGLGHVSITDQHYRQVN